MSLDAFRGRQFAARVKRIAPYVVDFEKQARTVEIEAAFAPAEVSPGLLLPGYSADVEVVLERHESVLRIPTEVLLDNDAVFVLSDGKALKRRLKIGLRNWQFTEVLEGIAKGDQIIINLDAEGLHEGVEVKVRSNDDHTGSN